MKQNSLLSLSYCLQLIFLYCWGKSQLLDVRRDVLSNLLNGFMQKKEKEK